MAGPISFGYQVLGFGSGKKQSRNMMMLAMELVIVHRQATLLLSKIVRLLKVETLSELVLVAVI